MKGLFCLNSFVKSSYDKVQQGDWSPSCMMQRGNLNPRCVMRRGDFCRNHWVDFPLHHAAARLDSLLQNAVERFDSLLHDEAERFGSPLHNSAGSQTSIQITPRIWNRILTNFRVGIGGPSRYFRWKKTEVKNHALLPCKMFKSKELSLQDNPTKNRLLVTLTTWWHEIYAWNNYRIQGIQVRITPGTFDQILKCFYTYMLGPGEVAWWGKNRRPKSRDIVFVNRDS